VATWNVLGEAPNRRHHINSISDVAVPQHRSGDWIWIGFSSISFPGLSKDVFLWNYVLLEKYPMITKG